jgi:hypothetical protein
MSQITLGDLIRPEEILYLKKFLAAKRSKPNPPSVHNVVMAWIDQNTSVRLRMAKHGVLQSYGAYLFEHYLQLK